MCGIYYGTNRGLLSQGEGYYFLNKRANKRAVLAAIRKLTELMKRAAIIIGQDANFEVTPVNINRQLITTNTLDIFGIQTSLPRLCGLGKSS